MGKTAAVSVLPGNSFFLFHLSFVPVDKSGTSSCPGCLQAKPPWACHSTCWSSLHCPAQAEERHRLVLKWKPEFTHCRDPQRESAPPLVMQHHDVADSKCTKLPLWRADQWTPATQFSALNICLVPFERLWVILLILYLPLQWAWIFYMLSVIKLRLMRTSQIPQGTSDDTLCYD